MEAMYFRDTQVDIPRTHTAISMKKEHFMDSVVICFHDLIYLFYVIYLTVLSGPMHCNTERLGDNERLFGKVNEDGRGLFLDTSRHSSS
jgi:hypothetical protein